MYAPLLVVYKVQTYFVHSVLPRLEATQNLFCCVRKRVNARLVKLHGDYINRCAFGGDKDKDKGKIEECVSSLFRIFFLITTLPHYRVTLLRN